MAFVHQTVLLKEAVEVLKPGAGKVIVDGTLGGGGHSEALLAAGATVVGVDRDPIALAAATARLASAGERFTAVKGNYAEIPILLRDRLPVDGLLLDLGVSSPQFDEASRGFSFSKDGPLDMRMSDQGETAAELIESSDEKSLADFIYQYGEESFSRQIARELKKTPPKTTFEAAEVVKRAVPRKAWPNKLHVATKTFQALRIAVNDELGSLETILKALHSLLKVGGRAAIISFHSLEDRAVKAVFRALEGECNCPPGLPICACGMKGDFKVLTKKAIAAGDAELEANPRSRSAHLRAVERLQ
ncbi:MAG: 16S rRNA (cytosine(1402)-N(4))-methyltransferase RsmH [Myxococcaceae bacterium]